MNEQSVYIRCHCLEETGVG